MSLSSTQAAGGVMVLLVLIILGVSLDWFAAQRRQAGHQDSRLWFRAAWTVAAVAVIWVFLLSYLAVMEP